jgi:thiamine kinase-like enzyme
MNPIELLQQINKIHEMTLTMVKQYAQGEQGAFAVADPAGQQYVLKWRSDLKHVDHLHKEDITETNDIVHFDFHNLNMLVYQQEISGIIDWDATCAGDAAFDLATLLFYASAEVAIRE